MLNTILGLLIAVAALASGCGKAPDLSTSDLTAAAQPKVADVTQTFAYLEGQSACNALKAWDSSTSNIQYTNDPGGYAVYLFTATGVTQNGISTPNISITISVSGTHYCSVTVSGGKIVSVQ